MLFDIPSIIVSSTHEKYDRKKLWIPFIFLFFQTAGLAQTNFVEASQELGFEHTYGQGVNGGGGGASFYDFNNDGWDDITMATENSQSIKFYKNNRGTLELVSFQIPLQFYESKHVLWVDYDNDGDKDLFVTNYNAPDFLYQNDGNFGFTDVTEAVGLSTEVTENFGASWVDINKDGWLDVYITNRNDDDLANAFNRFFKSNQDGTFTEITDPVLADKSKLPFASTFFDYDNDSWEDVYIAQDLAPRNSLLRNNGDETFSDVAKEARADMFMAGMCVAVGDYDNNGFFDIYISNTQAGGNRFLHNNGDGTFSELSSQAGLRYHGLGWGSVFLDHDNDGDLDIYASGTVPVPEKPDRTNILYHNEGDGVFTISQDVGFKADTAISYANAIGDINNDGFSDIVVNNHHPHSSHLWLNKSTGSNYIKVKLQGTISNSDAIGSRIEVYADGSKFYRFTHCGIGFLGQNSNNEIIGIGQHQTIDSVRIIWPSGHIDCLKNVNVNQSIEFIEGENNDFSPEISTKNGVLELCQGESIKLGVNLFGSGVTYNWSSGETTPTVDISESGTYSVDVRVGEILYNLEKEINLIINPTPQIEFTETNISCFGDNTGLLEVEVTGGLEPYTYLWSNDKTASSIDRLIAGEYSIEVKDANNCVTSKTASLSEPDDIELDYDVNQQLGSATILASGGTPPYRYLWNDESAQTTQTGIGLSDGIYRVFVTDNNECIKFINVEVSIVLSLEDEVETEFYLYPNPTNQVLLIKLNNEQQIQSLASLNIQVFNAFGQEIDLPEMQLINGEIRIETHSLNNGIYILKLESNSIDKISSRFLINR